MDVFLLILSGLFYIVSFGCAIVIIVNAFKDELWKGLLCIFGCGLYIIYYAFIDYDEQYKWPVVGGWIGGSLLGSLFVSLIK